MLDQHDFYIIDSKVDEIGRALGLTDLGMDRDVTAGKFCYIWAWTEM